MNSKYFTIYFDKQDESFAQILAAKADKVYEDIVGKFGFDRIREDEKITVTICESIPRYLEVTHKTPEEYQEWMVGSSDLVNRNITILSPRVSTTHTGQELEKVFVHEAIHMIFDSEAGNEDAPIWCAEGIAILYADQTEWEYVEEADYPRIGELLDEETFAECGGYDYAGIYVWYFIEQYGFAKFWEVYRHILDPLPLIYDGFEKEAIRKMRETI